MLIDQFHTYFKLKSDKSNSLQYTSWLAEEIDYWLNVAIPQFAKTRYSGNNPKKEGFEQTQKRVDDLRTLIREVSTPAFKDDTRTNKEHAYIAMLPDEYLFEVGEEATIAYRDVVTRTPLIYTTSVNLPVGYYIINSGSITVDDVPYITEDIFYNNGTSTIVFTNATVEHVITRRVGIFNSTADSYNRDLLNPFAEYKLHYNLARPIRLFRDSYVELVTDGNYGVSLYHLRYLKRPDRVSFFTESVTSGNIEPLYQYKVMGGSVIYDGTTYTSNSIFTGTNVTTFTVDTGSPVIYIRRETDMPEHTHEEILTLAWKLASGNTDNTQQYQISTADIQQME